ncbi:MarR family winged helix-turn-helix transcriptional regulator [uncultured Mitsuokella sp.]|uniref:MarR family winged helix-turn-helix transcriptional regulator n=1 Tax=uncultured Mitsuokella sp. TaxID=453120 RepID=UPI0026106B50|nr:MarR family transcriptional regulator [uncultured Mitsuokella sp.]
MDTHIWQENDTDRLMHQIHQTMRLFAKTLNQEIARSGIYSSEWTVLNLIHHRGECAQAELSPYLGIEPAAISKTLVKMEEKGVITRVFRNEPRGKFVRLTEKGETLFTRLQSLVASHRHQALQGLSAEDCHQLYALMHRIQKNLQQD